MLPRPLPEPFDSDEHLFEPWWGGERALVSIGPADASAAARSGSATRPAWTSRRHSPSWPGWPSGSRRGRRSSTASWSWSTARVGPIADELARRLRGRAGPAGGVPRLRPAASRRSFAALAAAGPSARGAATRAAAGRRGGRGAGHRDRGDRAVRGGRRPGHRRDPGPPAAEPLPARSPQPAVAVHRRDAGGRGRRPKPEPRFRCDVPGPAAAPVLALISRLPLDDDWPSSRGPGPRQALRAAATNARIPGPLPVQQHAGRVHPGRHDRDDRDRRDQQRRSTAATSHGSTAETIIRASITNGLNGGRNDATVHPRPAAAAAARRSRSGSRPSPRRLSGSDSVWRSSGRLTNEPIAA